MQNQMDDFLNSENKESVHEDESKKTLKSNVSKLDSMPVIGK